MVGNFVICIKHIWYRICIKKNIYDIKLSIVLWYPRNMVQTNRIQIYFVIEEKIIYRSIYPQCLSLLVFMIQLKLPSLNKFAYIKSYEPRLVWNFVLHSDCGWPQFSILLKPRWCKLNLLVSYKWHQLSRLRRIIDLTWMMCLRGIIDLR